jgi:hypothetical protein
MYITSNSSPLRSLYLILLVAPVVRTLSSTSSSRRIWISQTVGSLIAGTNLGSADAASELPDFVRPFTNLAPLGKPTTTEKTTGLSLQQLADRLKRDLTVGATGQGGYFLSGDLSTDIFRDDCIFLDPTNEVASLSQYQRALRILFDPNESIVQLLSPLAVNEETRTISANIRSRGFLQLPWKPYVTAYESVVQFFVDENGLVSRQSQTWSKSASQALKESFTPTLFTPPPKSNISAASNEPLEVSKLFEALNGRRAMEYSQEEHFEIDSLIDEVVAKRFSWDPTKLAGKWMLCYLQRGPTGGGVDRRIPFPEFSFNDNFQVFGKDSVLNVGEIFGPSLRVEVAGRLRDEDPTNVLVPKRLIANIEGGKLCWQNSCIALPIHGEGLFDGVYLGERLRIGQNVNGSGARVVQVRLS